MPARSQDEDHQDEHSRCGQCWSNVSPIVSEVSQHVTSGFTEVVTYDLVNRGTVTEVATKYRISPHIATRILEDALVNDAYLPEICHLDKFKASTEYGWIRHDSHRRASGTLRNVLPSKSRIPGCGESDDQVVPLRHVRPPHRHRAALTPERHGLHRSSER